MIEKFLGTYSNGWGHLIFSSIIFVAMTIALATGKIDFTTFEGICLPVIMFWFGTGFANRIAQVKNESPSTPNSPVISPMQTPEQMASNGVSDQNTVPTLVIPSVKGRKSQNVS